MKKYWITFLAMFVFGGHAVADDMDPWHYTPAPENLEAREWFQDAKFGIFIHWGIYSQMAGGGGGGFAEWIMENRQIPISRYEMLADFFNPVEFDADEWVKTFKETGAKYITITAKHHDGFAMYDSDVSDYDIVDSTPYGKDILAELRHACDKHGLKLFVYYSNLDWHHPDYYPWGRTGRDYTGRPVGGDWNAYLDYQNDQLREILTNYGEIGGLWFDGWWDHKFTPQRNRWGLKKMYELIHELQPQTLIINNHHEKPYPGEDVQPFEQDLPGENDAGFNTTTISALPLEMAETMNTTWGYSIIDDDFKSVATIIHTLAGAAGRNSNLLLNTGPMPNGRLQEENIESYKEIGKWLKQYGESIYGTRGGPVSPHTWGVTTQTDEAIYVHILELEERKLFVPIKQDIDAAVLLKNGTSISYEKTRDGLLLNIPLEERSEIDVVVKLTRAN